LQFPLQHGMLAEQVPPFAMHIGGVDVEVVLVDVEVVGVVVDVEVVLVGVVVDVEVVLVGVVDVEVVLVSHGPRWSPWPRWP
jgi:hypothetical protein